MNTYRGTSKYAGTAILSPRFFYLNSYFPQRDTPACALTVCVNYATIPSSTNYLSRNALGKRVISSGACQPRARRNRFYAAIRSMKLTSTGDPRPDF